MFQFETVDECGYIPWNVIKYALSVVFPDCCYRRTKETKNTRIDSCLLVYWGKRNEYISYFICSKKLVRQRISLKNGGPEVEFERASHKEMVICFNVCHKGCS